MPARLLLLAALLLPLVAAQPPVAEPGSPRAEKVAGGLKMPVDIEWGRDGALYVAELADGQVLRLREGGPDGPALVDLEVSFGGERGLVGMALDPLHTGRIWVYYTMAGGGKDDTPQWRGTNRLSWFEQGRETVVAEFGAGLMHNGGRLAFSADGASLYVTVGDNADRAATQDLGRPEGKLLRIDREGRGVEGNLQDRIVSYGHRNQYGLAVSPSGQVLMTENMNGQNDEINLIQVGGDYQWPHCEGTRRTDSTEPCDYGRGVPPLFEYTSTISPTGAAWMGGSFWFGAFNKGDVHRVWHDGAAWRSVVSYHHPETPRILDVTPGPEGNTLYFSVWTVRSNPAESEGQVWRLTYEALPAGDPWVRGLGGAEPTPPVLTPPITFPRGIPTVAAPLALLAGAAAAAAIRRR